jgi:hypothetical protein
LIFNLHHKSDGGEERPARRWRWRALGGGRAHAEVGRCGQGARWRQGGGGKAHVEGVWLGRANNNDGQPPAHDPQPYKIERTVTVERRRPPPPPLSTKKMRRSEMEKGMLNAAVQRARVLEDFAHSAENRRRGPSTKLT